MTDIAHLTLDSADSDFIGEQYRTLSSQVPTMYLLILLNTFFLAVLSARSAGVVVAYMLPGLLSCIFILRAVVWFFRKGSGERRLGAMRSALRTAVIIAGVMALALSGWSILLLGRLTLLEQCYVPLFTIFSTVSCAACLSSLPLAAYLIVIVGTVPIAVALIASGNPVLMQMGVNLLVVGPLVIYMVSRQYGQLVRIVAARSETLAEKQKVDKLAYRDQLTDLPNRRAFLDGLHGAYTDSKQGSVAVAMIDLDGFKMINDSFGHSTGDALLCEAARRLAGQSDRNDLIARLGGDEFAVLLNGTAGPADARCRLTHIIAAFEQPFAIGDNRFKLSASAGLAFQEREAEDPVQLLNRADIALYEAKKQPSVPIMAFRNAMEDQARRRVMIEQALANPRERAGILLHYQPVFEARSGEIEAFEALARWTHPTLGVIGPDEFVPIAERAGLADKLTAHIFGMALDAAESWPSEIGLSVNISAAELNAPDLAGTLLRIMAQRHFVVRRLSIEVTETALMTDFVKARASLEALQQAGIKILLDDFGAGFASIGYLREIRFDGIKLDGSLIEPLLESEAARELLVGVLQLCRAIKSTVTAEMVETSAQVDLLRSMGLDHLQGYFLAKPMCAQDALKLCHHHQVVEAAALQ
jgi:diguanylate cyclase (GGDEF)-like protein